MRHLRILPLTMLVAFLLLGLKVGEAVRNGETLVVSLSADANAQQAEGGVKPAEGAASDATPVSPGKQDTKAQDDESDEDEPAKPQFSQVEVDLLQSLAKRRQELDTWAKQIQLKENMLIATEQRLNDKIDALQKMKKELEALLAQYNEQEDTKIRSLVKIYENMKPKDAARIFEELDMPVLLEVVDKMSERKVAPVLAAMNPTKAKDVTVQLAEQRKLQKQRPGTTIPDTNAAPPGAADSSANANSAAPSGASPSSAAPANNAATGR